MPEGSSVTASDGAEGPDADDPISREQLVPECGTFARHLTGEPPDAYTVEKYVAAHHARPDDLTGPDSEFGRILLRLARRSPRWTWLVDCHVRVTAPDSLVRRKLVLLVALLECVPTGAARFRPTSEASGGRVVGRIAVRGITFSAGVLASFLVLLPVRAGLAALGALRGGGRARDPGARPTRSEHPGGRRDRESADA